MMMEEVMKDIKSKLKCGRRGGGSDGILHAALIDRSRRRRRFARSRPPGKPLILSRDRGPYARAHEYRVLSSPDRPSDRRISEFDRHLPKFGHVFRSPLLPSPLLFSSGQRPIDQTFSRDHLCRGSFINADPPPRLAALFAGWMTRSLSLSLSVFIQRCPKVIFGYSDASRNASPDRRL